MTDTMAAKKRGLGERGLGALLAGSKVNLDQELKDHDGELREVPIDLIQRGRYQPRRDMDPAALQELADSIRQQGVMQPVVVRPIAEGRYELIAGERRWRATQMAGLDSIPARVHLPCHYSRCGASGVLVEYTRGSYEHPCSQTSPFFALGAPVFRHSGTRTHTHTYVAM